MDYRITETDSPEKIEGSPWKIPDNKKIPFLIMWVNDEPVGQIGFIYKSGGWWNDYAYIRKDMQGKGLYFLLLEAAFKHGSQFTDFIWCTTSNISLEAHYRRQERCGVKREIKFIEYKGFPIPVNKWPEFRRKFNLSPSKNLKITVVTDLRGLKNATE
jgi:GNAT superfamily N-acetyltransferase